MYVEPRSLLKQRRSLITRLGDAPDGLPRVVSINRGTPPDRLLSSVARAVGANAAPEEWSGGLRELAEQTRELVDSRQFAMLERKGHDSCHYLSWSNVKSLFGRTLFEEFLQPFTAEVATTTPPWSQSQDPGTFADTRAMVINEIQEEKLIKAETMSGLKLAIDLESDGVSVVRIDRTGNHDEINPIREFAEETLLPLNTARFTARSGTGSVIEGSLGQEYSEARRQLASQHYQWLLTLERQELLRQCSQLARRLQEIHDSGLVHGDLKPANILLTPGGATPIDSLDVPIGELSYGLSHDYAAPEQVIGEPVSPQTDQYALGVMLSKVVNGLLYGEEARFHIPVSSDQLEVFTLLKDPGIFLPPNKLNAPPEATRELKPLIQRLLSFQPVERYVSMNAFADELDKFLDRFEFSAYLECELRYGNLTQFEDLGLAWLIEDIHP